MISNFCYTQLWDLANRKIEDYCIAWRKGLRKVWKLPYDSSSLNVALVSDTIPLFDELCRRVMNFNYTCSHCDSNLVRLIVSYGIASGTSSPIGRNAVFCSSHFNMHIANVGHSKLTGRHCLELHNSLLEIADLDRAVALHEVIFIREGLSKFSNSDFSADDVDTFIRFLGCGTTD